MHLCEGRSPLIRENPASREHSAHGEIPDVLSALQSALSASGELQGLVTPVAPSRTLARSTVYFAGDTAAPAKGCRWVVKQHRQNGGQIDLEEPLHAAEQFRSLATLHRHFRSVDEPLGVPRPVALFGDLDAFAMQHVAGVQVNRLLRPAAVINPAPALEGAGRSGLLLSRLHDAARSAPTRIDTRAMADGILELAASAPPDISLPASVRGVLEALPSRVLECPTVGLHGDFAPVNVIVDRSGGAYAIDVDHYRSGVPEQDIARYLPARGGAARRLRRPPVAGDRPRPGGHRSAAAALDDARAGAPHRPSPQGDRPPVPDVAGGARGADPAGRPLGGLQQGGRRSGDLVRRA
jgi:hypothetical protein